MIKLRFGRIVGYLVAIFFCIGGLFFIATAFFTPTIDAILFSAAYGAAWLGAGIYGLRYLKSGPSHRKENDLTKHRHYDLYAPGEQLPEHGKREPVFGPGLPALIISLIATAIVLPLGWFIRRLIG